MSEPFDPYHRWLAIPPKYQPPDHYRLLGLEAFESHPDVIADAAERQIAHVRRKSLGQYAELTQKLLNEIAAAQTCLLNSSSKAAYDETLRARLAHLSNATPPTPATSSAKIEAVSAVQLGSRGSGAVSPQDAPSPVGISVSCQCGQQFLAAPHLRGKTVECPACRQPLHIPADVATHQGTPSRTPNPTKSRRNMRQSPEPVSKTGEGFPVSCRCGQQFLAAANLAGTTIECPRCRQLLHVPAADVCAAEGRGTEPPMSRVVGQRVVLDVRQGIDQLLPHLVGVGNTLLLKFLRIVLIAIPAAIIVTAILAARTWNAPPREQVTAVPDQEMESPATIPPQTGERQANASVQTAPIMVNSIGMRLQRIRGGEFNMGSNNATPSERPVHRVRISSDFYIGIHEVTQAQYSRVTRKNPSHFVGSELPVEMVTPNDANEFCRLLTENELALGRLPRGMVYRLPSEAEWEHAARAGTSTGWFFGNNEQELERYAWYSKNSRGQPHPVGTTKPNPWGLYDMAGNVWEWCQDRYDASAYSKRNGIVVDPVVSNGDVHHVLRGGSWFDPYWYTRSASRPSYSDADKLHRHGFRVVCAPVRSLHDQQLSIARDTAEATATAPGKIMQNSLDMELVYIPPGVFTMGSPVGEKDRGPNEHQVAVMLTKGFWLGRCEVTQEEFSRVMVAKPWSGQSQVIEGARIAASHVQWDEAVEFCRRLTEREREAGRLTVQQQYRLPSEAEWEYACRAGTKTRFSFGDDESQLAVYAWYRRGGNDAKGEVYAHLVGQKRANGWGLCDMQGNVWEWCQDIYSEAIPGGRDPVVTTGGSHRVVRGGSGFSTAEYCRSAVRWSLPTTAQDRRGVGFRVALGSTSGQAASPAAMKRPRE